MREKPLQQRRGRRAVDVVVAEDRHLLAPHDRIGERSAAASMSVSVAGSGSRSRIVGSRNRSASSAATPRPASTRATMSGTPCPWAMAKRGHFLALVQPVFPAKPGSRLPHTEEIALVGAHRSIRLCEFVTFRTTLAWPKIAWSEFFEILMTRLDLAHRSSTTSA